MTLGITVSDALRAPGARERWFRQACHGSKAQKEETRHGVRPRRDAGGGSTWRASGLPGFRASGRHSGSVQHAPRRQASAADDRLSHTPVWHAEGPAHRCQPIQPWPWQRLGQGCGRADTRPRRGGDPRLSRPPPGGAQSGAGQPRFPRGNRGPELAPLLTRAPNRALCCSAALLPVCFSPRLFACPPAHQRACPLSCSSARPFTCPHSK